MTKSDIKFDISPDAAAPPQAAAALRSAILTSHFPPATRLSEHEIAAAMGLSRQPVREAFIRLAAEGLLEIRPQRGTYVTKISVEEVLDASFVREAVEADLARLAALHNGETHRLALSENLTQQQACTDPAQFMVLDESFHRLIAKAAGKARAWDHLQRYKSQMDRVRFLAAETFPHADLVAQHRAIFNALADHDSQRAELAMRGHLHLIHRDLPRIRSAYPEYFTANSDD